MKQALFQETKEEKKVQCSLCCHRCLIADGRRGICAVRENKGGVLYTLVNDKIIAQNIDPIEKKPLFHFLPGSLSYTYTEPTIFFELAYDTARLAVDAGLKNVFVTNGYITPEALEIIRPYLHAANIDLKGFTEDFYKKVCGAKLKPVLDAIKLYKKFGIWIEITTLVITGHNDSEAELKQIAEFVK